MASSYTVLGTEKMTTGENAGTWGTTTNTNLEILEQAFGGYLSKSIAGGVQTTTLAITDGDSTASTSEARHHVIKLTGTITGNQTVTVPADVVKTYIVSNATSGAYTVLFKAASASGFTFAATNKGTQFLFADGTNIVDTGVGSVATYDLDGGELTLDADSDTSITASTDDQIDFEIAGADDFTMTANAFNVLTGSHATFADSANAKFGTGSDMLVYHDGSNSYITNATGALKLATETSGIALTIGHTTSEVTVADNLTVTGTLTGTLATAAQGSVTSLGTLTTLTVDNIITNGTTIGHTSDTDLLTLTSAVLTVAGELDAATLDISGNADIDGTTNLDAVDIDGAVQIDGTVTVGVDDTGLDVKFFGASAGAYALWDESADLLDIRGATAAGAGYLKLTTGELTVVDADKLGRIDFQAPLESSGTDAILVGASIWAEADDTFAAGVNNTDLVFALGKSEAAAERFRFTADTEIGIGGANYGTDGQVLTSGGAGAACAWEDSATGAVTAINNATANELVTIGSTTTELDAEANLTFDGTDVLVGGAGKLQLRDTALFINSSTDGQLDIDADTEVEITTTTVDLNGALDVSGNSQFSGTVTVGVDNTGKDVKLFGATSGSYWLWDESADGVVQIGTLTVGVDDAGHDVKLFGDSAGAYMEWDTSADQLRIMGASADATTSTGKLLLATSLTDINANDVIGKIEFQAPHESGGTDAITVAASIQALAQATFSSSVNATDLIFYTGHSEAATEKFRFTSQGELGVGGANYGTDGQILTSTGAGTAPAWEDAAAGGASIGVAIAMAIVFG